MHGGILLVKWEAHSPTLVWVPTEYLSQPNFSGLKKRIIFVNNSLVVLFVWKGRTNSYVPFFVVIWVFSIRFFYQGLARKYQPDLGAPRNSILPSSFSCLSDPTSINKNPASDWNVIHICTYSSVTIADHTFPVGLGFDTKVVFGAGSNSKLKTAVAG